MAKETVKKIQKIIGAGADGVAGRKTKDRLWDYCDEAKLLAVLPSIGKQAAVPDAGTEKTFAVKAVTAKADKTDGAPTDPILDRITKVLAIFEMGKPEFAWGSTYWYADGPGGKRQCTLSMGFTETGSLQKVLDRYIANSGKHATSVKKYRPQIGKFTVHRKRTEFAALMKKCGEDPVMREAQVFIFQNEYLSGSEKFCADNGFKLALSRLVFADSKLHSGSPAPSFLRKRFAEVPPAKGGNEKKYVEAYSKVRRDWLAGHSRKILRPTAKRPRFYLALMADGNWELKTKMRLEGFII